MRRKKDVPTRLPDSHEAFAQRLEELIRAAGSARALAEASDVSSNAISLWRKGSEPGRDNLIAVAKAAGVSPGWLMAGVEPKRGLPEGYILIGRLQPGSGNDESGIVYIALKRSWIESLPGNPPPTALFLFDARDDAMAPLIARGDLILCQHHREMGGSGLYVIHAATSRPTLMVRRIAVRSDGTAQILCDNPAYAGAAEIASSDQFTVVGRAIWAGGLL
jgi:phage repressor protein C with HTH and peptisase S24 domain